jgi:myo-inositol-1(or 4)-monophosphatase
LVGNFTGESDFLYQREVVAATPRIYGQLVQMLAPYTRVIKEPEAGSAGAAGTGAAAPGDSAQDATQAFAASASASNPASAPATPAASARKSTRIRKADLSPADDAPF